MRVHHVALRTDDLARLERFYVDVLGFRVTQRSDERSVWLDAGEAIVMLERADAGEPKIPEGSREFLAFAIMADEKLFFTDRLKAGGVSVEHATEFTIYFRDPDGRRIGLSHFSR